MDLSALPVAALPLPPSVPSGPSVLSAPRKDTPLAQRFQWSPTISVKIDYYDLAQTKRAPFDLRTAAIFLCLCAHDNGVWFEPRSPEHRDGEDLPPVLNFAAWLRYIREWQNEHLAFDEENEIIALAIRVWTHAHGTVCVPEGDTKKNATPAPTLTGPNSTPVSSPAATPAADTTSSTGCPSAPPMPSSTRGSASTECPASAPPSPPAATPK
jgi:hypothetical protein